MEAKAGAYCNQSLMILLFNMYLSGIDQTILKIVDSKTPKEAQTVLQADLKAKLEKCVRYVKYCLMMLEIACSNRARRQELIYRCHFDYLYIACLNYLYGLLESTQAQPSTGLQSTATDPNIKTVLSLIEASALQVSAFLPALVSSVDLQQKNFTIMVRMKRQRFNVKCTSLSYKLIMDTLLVNGSPLCELETLEVHKVSLFVLTQE